jgi:DNA-binding response OmpR family regulator
MAGASILLVEDSEVVVALVRRLLETAGHEVVVAADGRSGVRAFFEARPDLVVLDVELPRLDGWQVLERIREVSDLPVIMLTAQAAEEHKVRGLRAGADDYLAKPFGRQELLARVEALLRRAARTAPTEPAAPDRYEDEHVTIDFREHRVMHAEREIELTPREFSLLAAMVRHPSQLLSHDQLLELAWDDQYGDGRDRVKVYVGYLRRKLVDAGACDPIETVRGLGYRYRPRAVR